MNGLQRTLAEIRHRPQRLLGVALAVLLSVSFMSTVMVLVSTEQNGLQSSLIAPYARADVLIMPGTDDDPDKAVKRVDEVLAAVGRAAGVGAVQPLWQGTIQATSPAFTASIYSAGTDARFRWAELTQGEWPTAAGQLAVANDTAARYGLTLGSTVTVQADQPLTLTVTGIVSTRHSILSGISDGLFLSDADLANHPELAGPPAYLVAAQPGTDPTGLVEAVRTAYRSVAPSSDVDVQLTSELAATSLDELTGGFAVLGAMLLSFAVIAMLVSTIIIANTFQIIVAQRQRQIALLRVVGADAATVARNLLIESLVIGAVSSLMGALLGIGFGAAVTAFTGSLAWGLQVPLGSLLLAALFGTVITLIGALGPSRRARAVSPMAALRPPTESEGARTSRTRAIVATGLAAAGLALIVVGMTVMRGMTSLVFAIAGSVLVTLGVLLAAQFVIPPTIRLLGGVAGRFGAPGHLAVANALRNPARSTATGVALMLAIGLVVMLQVGAASITASATAKLDSSYPVDLAATFDTATISTAQADRVKAIDGVENVEIVHGRLVTIGDETLQVLGLRADSPVVASGLESLNDSTVLAQLATANQYGWTAGEPLALRAKDGASVGTATLAPSNAAPECCLLVTPATLARIGAADPESAAPDQLWISLKDNADLAAVTNAVQAEAGSNGYLQGAAATRAVMESVLSVLVGIASGLMAVAVLIALIGVGNTVSLSVVERARELALLRALGLQRGQLRLSLVIECVLLALAGSLVGIVAGIGFGWLGTAALLRSSNQELMRFTVSAPTTLAVALVAVLAGALAALLPARQALKASPVSVLADE